MTSVGYATLDIIPSMRGIEAKLNSGLAGPMSTTGKKAGTVLGRGITTSVGSAAKGIALSLGAAFAAAKIKDFFGDAISEGREAQKVTALTTAAIKSTGGAAKVTAGEVALLSEQISRKVGVDDEAIQSGANLLLTFKNIRNEAGKGNDIFNQATATVQDMAAALGTDARGSAIQLGKALNDPVLGVTALGRAGVQFTEQQKEQIKTMVESGRTLEAQKLILGELASQVGGAAAAQATWGEKAHVVFDNMKEDVGTSLLPVLDDLSRWFVKDGSDAVQHWVDWFKKDGIDGLRNFGDAGMDLLDDLKPLGESLLDTGKEALPVLTSGLKSAVPLLKTLADTFNSLPDGAQKLIVMGAGAHYMSRQFGPLGSLLPGFATSMGNVATNTGTAGANAGTAASKFGGLKGAIGSVGYWAAIAVALEDGGNRIADIKALLSDPSVSDKKGLAGTLETIQNSDFADYADELGIDVERLARNFDKSGESGAYVQEVFAKLEESIGKGGWKAVADTLIPLDDRLGDVGYNLGWNADQALAARGALMKLIPALTGVQDAAKGTSGKGWFVGLAGSLSGSTALVEQYGKQLRSLPRKAITEVLTPGALKSTKDVADLAHKLDLTPKQTKTIMKILDFATPDIKKVLKGLDETDRKRPEPVVKADTGPASTSLRGLLGGPIREVEKPRPFNVSANTGDAIGKLQSIKNWINAVTGNWYIDIFTRNHGAGHATGGLITGPGTGTSDDIPAMLSNREYVVKAAAVQKYGVGFFDAANAMRLAGGGPVGNFRTTSARELSFMASEQAMRTFASAARSAADATKDATEATKKDSKERLKALERRRDMLDEELSETKERLSSLRQERQSLIEAVTGRLTDSPFASSGGYPEWFTPEMRTRWDMTTAENRLTSGIADAKAMAEALRTLKGKGFDGQALADLAQNSSVDMLQAYAAMSRGDLRSLESDFEERARLARQAGRIAGDAVYKKSIDTTAAEAQAQTIVLKKVEKHLAHLAKAAEHAADDTGKAVARAINDAAGNGVRRKR